MTSISTGLIRHSHPCMPRKGDAILAGGKSLIRQATPFEARKVGRVRYFRTDIWKFNCLCAYQTQSWRTVPSFLFLSFLQSSTWHLLCPPFPTYYPAISVTSCFPTECTTTTTNRRPWRLSLHRLELLNPFILLAIYQVHLLGGPFRRTIEF